jgi:hypothetical protein
MCLTRYLTVATKKRQDDKIQNNAVSENSTGTYVVLFSPLEVYSKAP